MSGFSRLSLKLFSIGGVAVLFTAVSFSQALPHYLITNNDDSQGNSATFYNLGDGGKLAQKITVPTGGVGLDGLGLVATNKISISHDTKGDCAYLTDQLSSNPDVAAISISTLKLVGNFKSAASDQVSFLNMAMAMNAGYVYASFTASQTIGTYKRLAGCKLQFLGDISAIGLASGSAVVMTVNDSIMVVTFSDGSIESFNLSGGTPVSNGDLQYSTAHAQNFTPQGSDITSDGHFVIFADEAATSPTVEVSDISGGKLTPTIVYTGLGSAAAPTTVWLSPNEELVYMSDFSSGQVTAAFFDSATGVVSTGCTSAVLKGFQSQWSFPARLATLTRSGTGGVVYVAEPDTDIGFLRVSKKGENCILTESASSPVSDNHTIGMESIAVFPPRGF